MKKPSQPDSSASSASASKLWGSAYSPKFWTYTPHRISPLLLHQPAGLSAADGHAWRRNPQNHTNCAAYSIRVRFLPAQSDRFLNYPLDSIIESQSSLFACTARPVAVSSRVGNAKSVSRSPRVRLQLSGDEIMEAMDEGAQYEGNSRSTSGPSEAEIAASPGCAPPVLFPSYKVERRPT